MRLDLIVDPYRSKAGDAEQRRFLVRTTSPAELRRVSGQLGAAYPQALRPFNSATFPNGDPAQLGPDEQLTAITIRLRAGEHLPRRTFEDRELDTAGSSVQVDPLLGVMGALGDLPKGWRAVVQLVVLSRAPADWAHGYLRLALERPLDAERRADTGPSLAGPLFIFGLIGLYLVGSSTLAAWSRGDWLQALEWVAGSLAVMVGGIFVMLWLRRRDLVDPRLVQARLGRDACYVELRLGVLAPGFADVATVQARLDRLAAAYRPFTLATGNSLVPKTVTAATPDLRLLGPLNRPNLLNVRELAGLWHLPQARKPTTSAFWSAPPLAAGCPYRAPSRPEAQMVPAVALGSPPTRANRFRCICRPDCCVATCSRVAKTRRGKSSLLLQLVHHLMQSGRGSQSPSGWRRTTLCGPGRPASRFSGFGAGPDPARAPGGCRLPGRVQSPSAVWHQLPGRRTGRGLRSGHGQRTAHFFRREFHGYWGPRLEDAFRFAVLALFEANETICAEDPRGGRSAQHTILDVPAVLERSGFRRQLLKKTRDPVIRQWFEGYFQALDQRFQLEIINPVQTKVHKYLGSRVARQIVGQPRSTIDFRQLMADGNS